MSWPHLFMVFPLNSTIMFSSNQAENIALENKLPKIQMVYLNKLELHKSLSIVLWVTVLFPVLLTF